MFPGKKFIVLKINPFFKDRNKTDNLKDPHTPRFDALTGLRAIAAMMIFGFHLRKFWVSHLPGFLVRLNNEFQCGVSIFFVLSGFLIAYTYQDRPLDSSKDYWKYTGIRLARIFPVYLLLLTAKYASSGFPPVKETFLNYTLLKGFSDIYNLTGIPQAWSLTVEVTFYFLAPWIYMIGQRKTWLPVIYGITGFFLVTALGLWAYKTGNNRDSWFYNYLFVLNATFFGRFLEFYMGTLLAFVIRTPGVPHAYKVRYTVTGLGGILFSMFLVNCCAPNGFSPGTNNLDGVLIRNGLLPVFTALFIYGLIKETTWVQRLLSSRVLILLGNSSYIFYLIHINFGYYTLAKIRLFPDYNFTFLWLVSIVIYLLVERPLYRLAKKLIKGSSPVSVIV